MLEYIPVNEPLFKGNEKKYLMECIETGWISSEGHFVKQFEKQFGHFLGLPPGVSVCNGTAALETALYGLGVQAGDEVIMPSFTIISCVIAALRLGAKPVLVDIEPETWCMDVDHIVSKITERTKAIIAVHIYGHPVNMDQVFQIAKKYSLKILEDAAEVHGAEYYSKELGERWTKCGSIGDASAFSFYANKIVTTGEGGMVLSRDEEVLRRAVSYRNLCFKSEKRFFHTEIGYNFRMSNLQAAVGLAQVEYIDELIAIKRRFGEYYRHKIASIPNVRFQVEKPWAKSVYWMYCVELDINLELDAKIVMNRLRDYKIGTRPFFVGMHAQPVFKKLGLFINEKYPNTDIASRYGFYLPSGMKLTEKKIDYICEALFSVLN